MGELRRLAGLLLALAAAVLWAFLAAANPTNTYHFAPLVVAALWTGVDGQMGAGLTQRRIVTTAASGTVIAIVTAVILDVKGDLDGPVFWDSSDTAPVLLEHVLFAILGGLIGAALAIRTANTPPPAD